MNFCKDCVHCDMPSKFAYNNSARCRMAVSLPSTAWTDPVTGRRYTTEALYYRCSDMRADPQPSSWISNRKGFGRNCSYFLQRPLPWWVRLYRKVRGVTT